MTCSVCHEKGHSKRQCPHVDKSTLVPRQENGGRKREHTYPEVFEKLGDPPDDPLGREKWYQKILATMVRETLQGRGSININASIVSLINTSTKVAGRETILEAADKLKGDKFRTKPKPKGPTTQKVVFASKPVR